MEKEPTCHPLKRQVDTLAAQLEARRGGSAGSDPPWLSYNPILRSLPFPAWITDGRHRVRAVNAAALRQLERAEEEVLGESCFLAFHNEASPPETCLCTGNGSSDSPEVREVCLGRSGTAFLGCCVPLAASPAADPLFLHVAFELSRRREMEAVLVSAEKRFRDLYERSREGFARMTLDGRIVECNSTFQRMLGYAREELLELRFQDVTPEKWHPLEARILTEEVLERGYSSVYEKECRTKDGEILPVEARIYLFHDDRGAAQGYWAFVRSLSDRKQAEKALRESEEKYRLVVENASEAILVAQDGVLKLVNPRAEQMTGYSREELTSKPFTDFIHPDDMAMVVENYRRRLEGEQFLKVYPFRVLNRQGETRWAEIHAVRILWEGRPATLNFLSDITRQKRAEEAREAMQAQLLQAQKLEAIGTLAGGVAHDFNNLLTGIQGYTDLCLMRLDASDPLYRNLSQIHQAADRAADLVRKLLLFSRKQRIRPSSLNMNSSVEDLLRMLKRLIGEDIRIETELAPDVWTVRADLGNMEQVIMNLALNARDAMPRGGELRIGTRNVELSVKQCRALPGGRPGRFVCLWIRDTGTGMTREVADRIFEPFFTTKKPGEGTGLGLSTAYGIIQQHQGWINVESAPGLGSTFRIYLPAAKGRPEEGQEPSQSFRDLRGNGERILLVEDEQGVREFSATVLAEHGYRVSGARTVQEALEIFGSDPEDFCLLFSDMVLPDATGLQLLDEVHSRRPDLKVLLTSGYSDERSQAGSVMEKGIPFLQKPYPVASLLEAVRDALRTAPAGSAGPQGS